VGCAFYEQPLYCSTADGSAPDATYRSSKMNPTDPTKYHYDVFPIMAVSSEAFSTIGFGLDQGGKGQNGFKMLTKMAGIETANSLDPYGKSGFTSISFNHGLIVSRPEWMGVIWSLAEI